MCLDVVCVEDGLSQIQSHICFEGSHLMKFTVTLPSTKFSPSKYFLYTFHRKDTSELNKMITIILSKFLSEKYMTFDNYWVLLWYPNNLSSLRGGRY